MPQFHIHIEGPGALEAFNRLDGFTQSYVEAIFWLLDETEFPDGAMFTDLAQESLAMAIEDCATFQLKNAATLASAYASGYSESQAGVDLWLTRNHHGAGFWDRGLGAIGDTLTEAARLGGCDSYLGDDGQVYLT